MSNERDYEMSDYKPTILGLLNAYVRFHVDRSGVRDWSKQYLLTRRLQEEAKQILEEHEREVLARHAQPLKAALQELVDKGVGVDLNPAMPAMSLQADLAWTNYLERADQAWRDQIRQLLRGDSSE